MLNRPVFVKLNSCKDGQNKDVSAKGEPCENFVILLRKRLGLNNIKHFTNMTLKPCYIKASIHVREPNGNRHTKRARF